MTIVLLVIIAATVVGLLRGGSFHELGQLELPGWWLVFAAVAAQVLGAFAGTLGLGAPGLLYVAGMVTSAVLIVVFVVRNRFVRGMPLIALGFAANALVVAANGAMPVSAEAVNRIGMSTAGLEHHVDAKHELIEPGTRLRLLADVIPVPVPFPVGSNVISAGDVALAAGIGVLVVNGMLRRPAEHAPGAARPEQHAPGAAGPEPDAAPG